MLAIAFGILASLCFAAASLLAQRGLHITPTPWGAWLTLVANTIFPVKPSENLTGARVR
jgi:hypothetical protein